MLILHRSLRDKRHKEGQESTCRVGTLYKRSGISKEHDGQSFWERLEAALCSRINSRDQRDSGVGSPGDSRSGEPRGFKVARFVLNHGVVTLVLEPSSFSHGGNKQG